jgi:hypothetical protein
MNVTMPDGTVIENVPDGITQSELRRRYAKIGAAPAAPQQPQVEDPGAMGSMAIGAGRVFDRAAAGLKDFMPQAVQNYGDRLGSALGMGDGSKLADRATQDANTGIYQKLEQQRPMSTMAGAALPMIAALPAVGSVGGAAAISALPGLISYGTPEEKLTDAALGAAGGGLGAGLGKIAGRVLNPVRSAPNAAAPEAMEAAARLGYRPPVGQEMGSKVLQTLEQQAAKNPISGRGAQTYNQANQAALNTAAARGIGESADQITEDVMAAARSRIGGEFDRLASDKVIPLDKTFTARIDHLRTKVEAAGPFKNTQAVDVLDSAKMVGQSGRMTGEAYQAIRSELTDMSRVASRAGNDKLAGTIKGVRKSMDDAAERVLSPEDLKAWKMARAQYASMKTLEKRGAVKAGDVDPAIIRNLLQSGDKGAFARGNMTGELADIARIGNAFRPLPDSGTAGNLVAQTLLSGGAGLMGPGALAMSLAAPLAANKALFSKTGQNYLRNGVVKVTPELEKRLMQGGYGLLGLPSLGANQ